MDFKINLIPLVKTFYIYKGTDVKKVPDEILSSDFFSITKTEDELSVLTTCKKDFGFVSSGQQWKGFKVEGTLDFGMVGILNEITGLLRENNISVFVISTFNTDYFFVRKRDFLQAREIFKRKGKME